MYHFIYKTTSNSGKYYIGRHSTNNINDGYFGSGKWLRSIKDKSTLTREILEYCGESNIKIIEESYLRENVGKENCMNFNLSSCGFSSGELNCAKSPEERIKRSLRSLGDKNPAKREAVRRKMSEAQKGKPSSRKGQKMSEEGRKNISKARIGLKISEEGKRKLSESRIKDYATGKRTPHKKSGWSHSIESKKMQSEIAKNREKYICIHCNKVAIKALITRWHNDNCKVLKHGI